MATETGPGTRETLESLTTRVRALEHGSVSKLGRAAIVIGCVGGLIGGISTLHELWQQITARAHFEVHPANAVTLTWEPHARVLAVTRNIGLQNTGSQIGTIVDPPAVRLESASLQNPEPLSDITATDSTQPVPFPLEIKAADGKTLSLVMASTLPETAEPSFPKQGVYKLVFSLKTSPTDHADVYCFQLSPDLIDQLVNTGKVTFLFPADPCT